MEKQLLPSEYRLQHDIPPYVDASIWGIVAKSTLWFNWVMSR
ncbi:MAG TPA: hypothetical protein VE710_18620 [Candidatus Bathyarchaeia archaeon]|nr:hypothetical protein [Candidatus Bathyarchaeia archaeon]